MALTRVQSEMAGAGQVLQVVQASYGSTATTSSGTLTASPLTVSITPKSATSKIYISISGTANNGGANGFGMAIARNSTIVFNPSPGETSTNQFYYWYSGVGTTFPYALAYLDSPATTSSTSYTLYYSSYDTGLTVRLNSSAGYQSGKSTITVMEIAA